MYHERRGSHHFTRVTENTLHALPREQMLQVPMGRTVEPEDEGQPVAVFTKALDGMQCDWGGAAAARSIRTPGYSLHAFHADCRTAFPELTLYVVSRGGERKPGQSDVSSGVDAQAEYLRTMGALFAVYWLCRIGIDGERGFSFGVGDDWLPREPPPADSDVPDELKRLQFFEKQEWGGLQQLFVDAGILTRGKISGTFTPNVERVAGILVLTAIHDIMKIEASAAESDRGAALPRRRLQARRHDQRPRPRAGVRARPLAVVPAVVRRAAPRPAEERRVHAVEDGLQPRLARPGAPPFSLSHPLCNARAPPPLPPPRRRRRLRRRSSARSSR